MSLQVHPQIMDFCRWKFLCWYHSANLSNNTIQLILHQIYEILAALPAFEIEAYAEIRQGGGLHAMPITSYVGSRVNVL